MSLTPDQLNASIASLQNVILNKQNEIANLALVNIALQTDLTNMTNSLDVLNDALAAGIQNAPASQGV